MTWNVENLFLPGPSTGTPAAYEAKIEALAAAVRAQAPDLLGLQEIGEPAVLHDLVAAIGGTGWTAVTSQYPDDRGIRTAWIARGPLDDVSDVREHPEGLPPVVADDAGTTLTSMRRGALAVTWTAPSGLVVRALTAHFKSKRVTYPRIPGAPLGGGSRSAPVDEGERARFATYALAQRAADAATVRAWATAALGSGDGEGRERAVLVCGDLNDVPRAATSELVVGPPGSEFGSAGFEAPDRGDGQRLWNTAWLMRPGRDWSRISFGRRELLDQVLVSHRLATGVVEAGAVDAAEPVDDVEQRPAVLPVALAAARPSDHRPVVVRVRD